STGEIVRKSITSADTPFSSNSSAARKQECTIAPYAINVTSEPSRFTSALPISTVYSSSGTSSLNERYNFICSKKITGSLSRIAEINNPFASYGVDGITTFNPGCCERNSSKESACNSGVCTPPPNGDRTVIG